MCLVPSRHYSYQVAVPPAPDSFKDAEPELRDATTRRIAQKLVAESALASHFGRWLKLLLYKGVNAGVKLRSTTMHAVAEIVRRDPSMMQHEVRVLKRSPAGPCMLTRNPSTSTSSLASRTVCAMTPRVCERR